MTAPDSLVIELFTNFIDLRKRGTARDIAWREVLSIADEHALKDRYLQRLLTLAKDWEKREGNNYRATQPDKMETNYFDSTFEKRLREELKQTKDSMPIVKPSTYTQDDDAYGGSTQEIITIDQTNPLANTARFTATSVLQLFIEAIPEPIQIQVPPDKEIIVGRSTDNPHMTPDVDLNVADGKTYGVSRMHAMIISRNNTLVISDLGSRNHTFVNGKRLHQHEIRVLHDGDIVHFGQLRVSIRFQH